MTISYPITKDANYGNQKNYLLILNDEPFNINISKGPNDFNGISYSASGDLLRFETDLFRIPKTKILAIEYSANKCPSNTTYKISTGKFQNTYKYYDSRGEQLVFPNKIYIGPLAFRLKEGQHHFNLTDTINLTIRKNSIIIFSYYRNVQGTATVNEREKN
ncbi:hypothetical protein TVAG_359470 [Trichomonas vaginalis G3]|uniref:Uncharacterized protein n=1 Tax=Trichomonas vaginalis (strain ATCC PRA-98 / G3) TaxID=412133 RepID=A2DT66_TRIV3|nr:hypothetical protein TVAGG3_0968730 [Trichomonas vaginalis G3]EAY16338.1 hypothetical protein TVAG_359470 [Trichomonas vaginalis G3]KAI5488436.1 hypothetical protein TVAGG3_0968730 [Trichomonas vaginalis G3]|eukprot:XP_001328561.1 hypothetical protein [Trichomonas vaginalis G3]